jgi:bacillithiol biosynthesis cysteine-adding enzyme BshC
VLPHSGVSAPVSETTSRLAIDIRRFPWISRLAADYVFAHPQLADFYAGSPADPASWRDAVARAQQYPRPRAAVVELLHAQQRERGAPAEALAATAQLRNPDTVAVVTGQQAGLFGGPLFTLLKALTAVRLAERVRAQQGVPAVAVFWIDAEDHDWNEVKSCDVLDADLAPRSVSLDAPVGAGTTAIARLRLDESATTAISQLESILQPTEFRAELVDALRRAYAPGTSMADAFGRLLESLLGGRGLVVYNAADPGAKPHAAEVFAREIDSAGETVRLAAAAGARLEALGYHAQAAASDGSLALFHLNHGREAIRAQGADRFLLGARGVSKADLLAHARRAPAEFSPSVLLRPLVQDTLFPTVCYVAGPSELAYLGQLKSVYAAFGIPMPLIEQRATATVVDANAMRFLTRHEFPLELLRAQDESALNDLLIAQLPPAVDTALEGTGRTIEEGLLGLAQAVTQIDPTLEGATRSTLTRMQDDLKRLHAKIVQAAKRKDDTLRRQFRHAQAQAFPGGHSQERALGFVYFLNKYGPALLDRVSDVVPGDPGAHYVLTV